MEGRAEPELVLLAKAGDGAAAGELVRRHLPRAWRAAFAITRRRELADDAVQDALERTLRSIGRVDPGRPFGAWLHRIVVNCSLDLLRTDARGRALRDDREPTTDGGIGGSTTQWELVEALRHLSGDARAVVVLRIYLGYSPDETAEMLRLPVGTVHSRLSRALAILRDALEVPRGA